MAQTISFGIFTAKQIAEYSVCEVVHNEPFTRNGEICENGPCDLRMGSFDSYPCKTCHSTQKCPGHFGHITLCLPMYNINFLPQVVDVLRTLCPRCCRLKISAEDVKLLMTKQKRLTIEAIRLLLKNKLSCAHCGALVPDISQTNGGYVEMKQQGETSYLHADVAHAIFEKMPLRDLEILGFTRHEPSDLLLRLFPVLPNTERPTSDRFDAGHQRSVDKLTYKIRDVLVQNKKLASMLQHHRTAGKKLDEQMLCLQDAVTHFYTDAYMKECFSLKKNIGSAFKRGALNDGAPLHARLKGKGGQLRSNLMGKRVDMTARTVIVGDPALDLNEIRVPESICTNLTVPERVTRFNIERLQTIVDAGPISLGGANKVIRPVDYLLGEQSDIEQFDLRFTHVKLQIGDIVERHLAKGDMIMFNRQPTLHRMSFLGMKVVPGKGNAFGMNVCA